ncbi:MAG: TlpA disulfide reductase family protein [Casimicrobiaceae bacterium]
MTGVAKAAGILLAVVLLGVGPTPAHALRPGQMLEAMEELAQAPDPALERPEGGAFRLSTLRGKVVVVNFWATWCPPCRREMPSLDRLNGIVRDPSFTIVGIDVGETAEQVAAFRRSVDDPPGYALALDPHGEAIKAFGIRGLPTTYVLDKKGRIAYRALGPRSFDDPAIVQTLRRLIEAP